MGLQEKIKQEEKFRKELLILFNRIRDQYRASVAAGNQIRAQVYEAQFKSLLEAHYRRVQKAFRGVAGVDINDDDAVYAALILWAIQTASDSSSSIVTTTQKQLDMSVQNARQALSDDGILSPSNRELAAVVALLLSRVFPGRIAVIATLETNRCAESTKLIEAYDSAGLDPTTLARGIGSVTAEPVTATKTWETMRDSRVRSAHVVAQGQTKPINQPFIVAGEKLMYPGDMSMGASIENVANCRCSQSFNRGIKE